MQIDLIKRTKVREDGSSAQVEASRFSIAKHDICVVATVKYPMGVRRGIDLSAVVEQFVDSIRIPQHHNPNQGNLALKDEAGDGKDQD